MTAEIDKKKFISNVFDFGACFYIKKPSSIQIKKIFIHFFSSKHFYLFFLSYIILRVFLQINHKINSEKYKNMYLDPPEY